MDKLKQPSLDDLVYVKGQLDIYQKMLISKNAIQVLVEHIPTHKEDCKFLVELFGILILMTEIKEGQSKLESQLEQLLENFSTLKESDVLVLWCRVICNGAKDVHFARKMLKSSFWEKVVKGLAAATEEVKLGVISIFSQLCDTLPESIVLDDLKALDPLSEVLTDGSPKVKLAVLQLLQKDSEKETHKGYLSRSIGPLVDILRHDSEYKEQAMATLVNLSSQDGLKLLIQTEIGRIDSLVNLYETGNLSLTNKANQLLSALGVGEEGSYYTSMYNFASGAASALSGSFTQSASYLT